MNKRFLIIFLVILIGLLVLAGCGIKEPKEITSVLKEDNSKIKNTTQETKPAEETPKEVQKGTAIETIQISEDLKRDDINKFTLNDGTVCYIMPGQADDIACFR